MLYAKDIHKFLVYEIKFYYESSKVKENDNVFVMRAMMYNNSLGLNHLKPFLLGIKLILIIKVNIKFEYPFPCRYTIAKLLQLYTNGS